MFASYLPTIYVHPTLIIFGIIAFLTGSLMELVIIFSLVFIHEMGHYAVARLYGWQVEKVVLWVFGGVLITNTNEDKRMLEEFMVTIAGPCQHLFIYFVITAFTKLGWIEGTISELILYYNLLIFVFNLLPIWPLDGGRILFFFLTSIFPFQKAVQMILLISMCSIILFFLIYTWLYTFALSILLLCLFLFLDNVLEWKRRFIKNIQFLLQLYRRSWKPASTYNLLVPADTAFHKVASCFYREKLHKITVVYSRDTTVTMEEKDYLKAYFENKNFNVRIGDYLKQLKP